MKRLAPGAAGWVSVAAVVIAAELLDEKTMSEAFTAASKHPVSGPVILTAWIVLTGHLFGAIPRDYDPIYLFWKHTLKGRLNGNGRIEVD